MVSTELLGFIGTVIIIVAYLPQMRHILKEHCSGGISPNAWLMWLVATVLIMIHAMTTDDLVFKALQGINLGAIIIILVLIKMYGNRICHSNEAKTGIEK